MRAGTLNRQIVIESRVETDDDTGDPVPVWLPFATVWGALEPGRGRQFVGEQQIESEVTGRIRIRYRPGVTAKMRAVVDGVPYDILAVLDLKDRHEEMHLLTSEGLNDG
jgi:SPP1 family predicted phage head-tail adaptor